MDLLKLRVVQGIEAVEDVRRLADHQAEVGEIERDLLEPQQRTALQLVALEGVGVEVERRQRHAALDAPLQLEQLDVHVDRVGELGMPGLDGAQFRDLARFGARRSGRAGRARADHTQQGLAARPSVRGCRVVRR